MCLALFISLSVCSSVRLSVSNMYYYKVMNGFAWNFYNERGIVRQERACMYLTYFIILVYTVQSIKANQQIHILSTANKA